MHTDTTRLVQLVINCSHRLNAVGRTMGATSSRGGVWGLMKSLQQEGPQTIAGLARSRPVSRQHIRQLAQDLISEGWIESVPNPEHKRSFLLQLTAGGKETLKTMDAQIDSTLSDLLQGLESESLETTLHTLSLLADRLQQRLA